MSKLNYSKNKKLNLEDKTYMGALHKVLPKSCFKSVCGYSGCGNVSTPGSVCGRCQPLVEAMKRLRRFA